MSIEFKNLQVLREMLEVAWHPKLIDLVCWMEVRYSRLVFTSGHRDGDPGVHGADPLRGYDLRSTVYPVPQNIVDDVNKHWIYDPSRPEKKCVLYHKVEGNAYHLHFQVHDNTVYVQ